MLSRCLTSEKGTVLGFAELALAVNLLSWLGAEICLALYPSERDRLLPASKMRNSMNSSQKQVLMKKIRNVGINRCHGKEYEKQGVHREYPGKLKFIFAKDNCCYLVCI